MKVSSLVMLSWFLGTILFLSGPLSLAGDTKTQQNRYHVPEVNGPVRADGVLNEEVWKKALVIELKYEVSPAENIPPPVKTEVLLAHSKNRLYIAFRAYDPDPSAILSRICDRDHIGNQDWVGVILDTFNDERRSFDFLCNPLGVQEDFIENSNSGGGDWDAIWDSGGRIHKEGYNVEMSIPFSSLRFQRSNGHQVWGFDAVRSYPRTVRHHIGTFPRDRNNNCYLCQSIKLVGFSSAKPGKNLEFDPTLSAHTIRERDEGTRDPFTKDSKVEPGLTARWGFTPNLTLSATANPDFSQVEADSLQMTVNEPFAIFFPEKRPFFLEGADFFDTRLDAVYTRAVRDPSWGIKITGKEGSNTIGAYMVRDTLTNLVFPGSEGSDSTTLSMDTTASVLRYKRDFGNKYTVGLMFTNREGTDYYNRVFGIDGDFRFTSKDRIRMQILGSSTLYPDATAEEFEQPKDRFNDKALDIVYQHDSRNFSGHVGYKDMGKDFRADLGFIPRVNYRSIYGGGNYIWYAKPNKWWSRFTLNANFEQLKDEDDNLLQRRYSTHFAYEGPRQMHSLIEYAWVRERYEGKVFDQNRFFIHHCMNPIGAIHLYFNVNFGDRIDYTDARGGKRLKLYPGISYHIGQHLRLDLSHTFERLWVNSKRLYTANQTELTVIYHFTKRMFVRCIMQYVDHKYNTENYISEMDPVYKHLFTQFLFSYKINPQTVLFLGYSDNYHAYVPGKMPQTNRAVFLKVGYALVL